MDRIPTGPRDGLWTNTMRTGAGKPGTGGTFVVNHGDGDRAKGNSQIFNLSLAWWAGRTLDASL